MRTVYKVYEDSQKHTALPLNYVRVFKHTSSQTEGEFCRLVAISEHICINKRL
jgi:hypothetical protein